MNRSKLPTTGKILLFLLFASPAPHAGAQTEEIRTSDILQPTSANKAPVSEPMTPSEIDRAVSLTIKKNNQFRKSNGFAKVTPDKALTAAAEYFASYMASNDAYGHQADGKAPSQRAADYGYDYCIVSENIAFVFSSEGFEPADLAGEFVKGWKDSEGHRKNILDPGVTETGVAIARSQESGRYYAVQMFGRPMSDQIRFQLTNETENELTYTLVVGGEESAFDLPVAMTRTHQVCRPTTLKFGWMKKEKPVKTGKSFHATESDGRLKLVTKSF